MKSPRKRKGGVALISWKDVELRIKATRTKLQDEIQLVKDLTFLKAHAKLLPRQEQAVDEAIYKANEVVAIFAEEYGRAVTELIAVKIR